MAEQRRFADEQGSHPQTHRCNSCLLEPGSGRVELKRHLVQVFDNVALVHLQAEGHGRTKSGHDFAFNERFTHVWLRTSERWQLIGGMAAPVVALQSLKP
jgi:ketosteroid isomerase-like protein